MKASSITFSLEAGPNRSSATNSAPRAAAARGSLGEEGEEEFDNHCKKDLKRLKLGAPGAAELLEFS